MKYFLTLLFAFLISACVSNTFEKNFISNVPDNIITPMNLVAENCEPRLLETDNVEMDIQKFMERDHVILGYNDFEGRMRSHEPAIEFAKKINATHVLYSREPLGKRYVDYKAATNTKAISDLGTYPSYHPENRKYLKENYYHYKVIYLRKGQS